MARDYQRLWTGVTSATDGVQAVQALAGILTDKDGRTFISRLDSKDAELCVEILHDVSPDLYFSLFATSAGPSGHHRRTPSQTRRETGFLRRVEETC